VRREPSSAVEKVVVPVDAMVVPPPVGASFARMSEVTMGRLDPVLPLVTAVLLDSLVEAMAAFLIFSMLYSLAEAMAADLIFSLLDSLAEANSAVLIFSLAEAMAHVALAHLLQVLCQASSRQTRKSLCTHPETLSCPRGPPRGADTKTLPAGLRLDRFRLPWHRSGKRHTQRREQQEQHTAP
jgi:hypothetical protein